MLAGFVAIWVAVVANEISHILVPKEDSLDTFGYEIIVPEGFGTAGNDEKKEQILVDIKPLLASASVEKGIKVARKCQSCHTFDEGGRNGTGPNLYNVIGSNLSSRDRGGFKLSESILEAAVEWNYDNLNIYLDNPKNLAPQGTMSFVGLKKPQDRADVIKFLMTKTLNPPEVILDSVPAETDLSVNSEGD